jgi:hypothetical protein
MLDSLFKKWILIAGIDQWKRYPMILESWRHRNRRY